MIKIQNKTQVSMRTSIMTRPLGLCSPFLEELIILKSVREPTEQCTPFCTDCTPSPAGPRTGWTAGSLLLLLFSLLRVNGGLASKSSRHNTNHRPLTGRKEHQETFSKQTHVIFSQIKWSLVISFCNKSSSQYFVSSRISKVGLVEVGRIRGGNSSSEWFGFYPQTAGCPAPIVGVTTCPWGPTGTWPPGPWCWRARGSTWMSRRTREGGSSRSRKSQRTVERETMILTFWN